MLSALERLKLILTVGPREQWIGLYIAVLAVVLAIASMSGSDAATTASSANVNAANLWAWFQGKRGRQTQYKLAIIAAENQLASAPDMPAEAHAKIVRQIVEFRQKVQEFQSEPAKPGVGKKGEGLKELSERAVVEMNRRDQATLQLHFFDYAKAFLQISIVFASIAVLVSGNLSLLISAILAAVSMICLTNGYLLVLDSLNPLLLVLLFAVPTLLIVEREHLSFGTLVARRRRVLKRRGQRRSRSAKRSAEGAKASPAE